VHRRLRAAGRRDDLEQPVAAGRKRQPLSANYLPCDRDGIGEVARNEDKHLRLDGLAGEALLDRMLHLLGGAACGDDPAGIRDADRAVGTDLLSWNSGARPAGLHGGFKQGLQILAFGPFRQAGLG